jgi:hypothetical protein
MASSAYSTIVNVSPETAQNLAEFICSLVAAKRTEAGRALYAELLTHISAGQTETLLLRLLDCTEDILTADREADAEGSFQALVPIMFTLADAASRDRVVKKAIQELTSSDSNKQKLRLQLLVSMFNLMVASDAKYELLIGTHASDRHECLRSLTARILM